MKPSPRTKRGVQSARTLKPATRQSLKAAGDKGSRPGLFFLRTPHDWPSYLMRGDSCVAWTWGRHHTLTLARALGLQP